MIWDDELNKELACKTFIAIQLPAYCLHSYFITPASSVVIQEASPIAMLIFCAITLTAIMMASMMGIDIRRSIEASVCAACTTEAVIGGLQLLGIAESRHDIFTLTGTLKNPGPLGGFLAIGTAVAINLYESTRGRGDLRGKTLKHLSIAAMTTTAIILPATQSRTAIIAAMTSAAILMTCRHQMQTKKLILCAIPCAAIVATMLFITKTDSGLGRLLIWKISTTAIMRHPLTGSGTFSSAYMQAQEDYFRTGEATETEMRVADNAEYAFNELIQTAIEYGMPLAIMLLGCIVTVIVHGLRTRNYGLACGIVSLLIFSMASYPLHIEEIISESVLMTIAIAWTSITKHRAALSASATCLAICCTTEAVRLRPNVNEAKKWAVARELYAHGAYEQAVDIYGSTHLTNPRYHYEYGLALHKCNEFAKSDSVLKEAYRQSGSQSILLLMGKNHVGMQDTIGADTLYKKAHIRVPNRLYPIYLLFRLHEADTLGVEWSRKLIEQEPKVASVATRRMKHEATRYMGKILGKRDDD